MSTASERTRVTVDITGGLATITLAQPPVNALDQALIAELSEAIDRGSEVGLDTGLELERTLFAGLFATEDQKTGMTGFMENGLGKAEFHGR